MFYLDSNNNKYYIGRAFTYGDYQYSRAAATHAKFIELGFTQVILGARPDSRFYFISGPDNDGNYSSTPRDLNDLKESFIRDSKLSSRRILSLTDWLVIRREEKGTAIDADVATFRDNVRSISDSNCALINACTTVAELETLVNEPTTVLSDPLDPSSALVTNTNPHLADYPDAVSGYDY